MDHTSDHRNRIRRCAGEPVVNWRGIAVAWEHDGPDFASAHIDDAAEFAAEFGMPATDANAEALVRVGSDDLWTAAEEQLFARACELAAEDGLSWRVDSYTGEGRFAR